MSRLFWKLFLALWLSIMGFALVVSWITTMVIEQHIPDTPEVAFSRSVQKVELMLGKALKEQGPDGALEVIHRLPRQFRNHVYLMDPEGHELLGRDQVRRMLRDPQRQFRRFTLVDANGQDWQLVILRRAPPLTALAPGSRGAAHRLLIAALVAALASFFVARWLARPLEALGKASRELASGDLSARVGQPLDARKDEFGVLARDLDRMASNLQKAHQANQRLLRDVSHELRSPLARLRVAVEIARNRGAGHVGEELNRIELEGERLETLVDQVLRLMRDSSGSAPINVEKFDLAELLEDLCNTVSYEIPEGAPGVKLNAQAPLLLTADRELLWRAIENLLRNALIYSGEQGDVEISATAGDDAIAITIRDHGPGIPAASLEHVFDAFYRVQDARDRRTGGHGLGMAIAAAAVRRHGGLIKAENHPEGGLEISVTLQRSNAAA